MLVTKEQSKPLLCPGAKGIWADGGRLLLLLQSFTVYTENLLSDQAVPPAQAVGPCMSAGLTARRYWCGMLKLGAFYQQLLAESHNNSSGITRRQHRRWERRDGHEKGRRGAGFTAEASCCETAALPTLFDLGRVFVLCPLRQKKACRKENPTERSTPKDGKPKKETLKHCSPAPLELRPSTEVARSASPRLSLGVRVPLGNALCSSLPRAARSMTESSRIILPQITGSSLAPCDACASVQASLREVGKAITSICQSQNIPSALSRFQEMVAETPGRMTLSAMDMSYWASEQSKDLSRISKHLQVLLQQVNPLKSELEESEKQKDKLQKQVEDLSRLLQAQKKTQAQQRKQAERNLEVKNKEHLEAVARLERDKDDLRRGAALLEERLSALKEELAAKQAAVQELEVTKTTLLEEMRTTMVARSQMLELEEKVQLLTSQRESLGQELSTTTIQLEKEKAKVESMLRHQEFTQAKQKALVQQLNSLDQEREELQASLGEAEEDKAKLAEQLEESREQSRHQLRVQQELADMLQREKLSLEQSVLEVQANVSKLEEQAQKLKERERLLVLFPDLHIPTETQFESTGSLTEDMENQLQANSIRISVLEEENARLKSALAKLKAAAKQGVLKFVPETQLWSQLSSQHSGEAPRQDAGRAAEAARAAQGRTDVQAEAQQQAPSSQLAKPPSAEPACKAGPCLSLLAEHLVLGPPEPRGRGRTFPVSSHHTVRYCK
ncbi:coiled-coil domain-containing protein 157 [Gavia stellata]|uniref:coiled-coil domain-containing protein 157 n=1 Tax=Gavia stellata TaxID=37040 RepID=UPI00289EA385|nr:coiled-coil domain-containing protein 157 [Gavia stellata]